MSQATSRDRSQPERRGAARFAIEQEIRYKLLNSDVIGLGKTVNISSRGLLFIADQQLTPGERLEVTVNWPAQLDKRCPLKLVTTGTVVRSQQGLTAVSIERYEFRTRARAGNGGLRVVPTASPA